jgi:hypothetical protein
MDSAAAPGSNPPTDDLASRELLCPITHELLNDPVLAEDGHTYERAAIAKWYSQGKTRSPVTNEEVTGTKLMPNLAIKKLVDQYRNDLGRKLLRGLESPQVEQAAVADLLQRGAQANIRDEHGATPLLLVISRGRLDLVKDLIEAGADPSLANDKGENAVAAARRRRLDEPLVAYLAQVEQMFLSRRAAELEARARGREENRRAQETLRHDNSEAARTAVPLVPGVGYFPSLFGLQFHGALSGEDAAAPVLRPQQGFVWSRVNYFADWARLAITGDPELPLGHEDAKQQHLLSRVLAALVAGMVFMILVL